MNPDGSTRTEKNPNYVKPSKVIPHPSVPGRLVNQTEDDEGNPVLLPVDDKTTVTPTDMPVLQARYGEIATGLGTLLTELNRKVAAGEMTPQERTEAFTAAHQQAEVQTSEIKSILDNSRAVWTGQVNQRGQTLTDTAGRRNFAQSLASNAATMANSAIARPGRGAAVGQNILALTQLGAKLAEGMGGFKDSPEVALPRAVQQAQDIGLPGYGGPEAAAGAVAAPGAAEVEAQNQATQAQSRSAFDALGIPPPAAPGALPPPIFRPQPPVGQMGSALGAPDPVTGVPVAAGGGGLFDPDAEMAAMVGDGSDPDWATAVARAMAEQQQQAAVSRGPVGAVG
jgi:hypothetical protein